jgi:CDP-diacylglycerol--glycerol-3-phosphate 3-phosphatidyltransferase
VADRFTDALLFMGVAWYLATTHPGRIAILPMAVMALSMLISYERAKAEALGYDAKGGLMERAERIIVLAIGLLFSQFLIPVLWVMLAGTALTAATRFAKVWGQATASVPRLADRSQERQRARARNRQDRRVARSTTRQVRRRTQLRPPR